MNDKLNTNVKEDIQSETIPNELENSLNIGVDVYDDIVKLPHGNALTFEETYRITSTQRVSLIVLVGPSGCGKTTLITTIYQLLQKGPLEEYYFAGSETLSGFEQRAFPTRITSGNASSQTTKTRRGILDSILHLKLWNCNLKVFQDLLITDFSGEDYRSIIANVDLAREEFGVIRRADHIVLLIDGELISNKKYRNGIELESLHLLKTIRDANLFNKNVCVDILISKYDIVKERSLEDATIKIFVEDLHKKFNEQFFSHISNLNYFNVAAMPEDKSKTQIGYGLSALVKSWVEYKDKLPIRVTNKTLQNQMSSEFNLYDIRAMEEIK